MTTLLKKLINFDIDENTKNISEIREESWFREHKKSILIFIFLYISIIIFYSIYTSLTKVKVNNPPPYTFNIIVRYVITDINIIEFENSPPLITFLDYLFVTNYTYKTNCTTIQDFSYTGSYLYMIQSDFQVCYFDIYMSFNITPDIQGKINMIEMSQFVYPSCKYDYLIKSSGFIYNDVIYDLNTQLICVPISYTDWSSNLVIDTNLNEFYTYYFNFLDILTFSLGLFSPLFSFIFLSRNYLLRRIKNIKTYKEICEKNRKIYLSI